MPTLNRKARHLSAGLISSLPDSSGLILKIKSTLKLDHASGQTAFGATEERVLDLRARAVEIEWLQIQEIEDIEKIRLYLKESSLAEQMTQTELFADRHVNVKVSGTAE